MEEPGKLRLYRRSRRDYAGGFIDRESRFFLYFPGRETRS